MKRMKLIVSLLLAWTLFAFIFVVINPTLYESVFAAEPEAKARQAVAAEVEDVQGTAVPEISDIIGVTYDETRGELVIIGVANPDYPPMSHSYIEENLIIALRAFYDASSPDNPGVSIEGTLDPLSVIYFGNVENTRFGQVAFESDRLLKTYTLGKDNITQLPVTSTVPGYMSYPDRISLDEETESDPIQIRYFFTPTALIEPSVSPPGFFYSATQKVIDWAYMSAVTSPASTNAAQGFVDNFNDHYFEYAAERYSLYNDTTLYEAVQLSKLATIAKWAQDEELELTLPGINDPWLNELPISVNATVTQTPGITVTWSQEISGNTYEISLRGGYYAVGEIIQQAITAAHQQLMNLVDSLMPFNDSPSLMVLIKDKISCPFRPAAFDCSGEVAVVAYVLSLADDAVHNGGFEDGVGSPPWQQISPFELITFGAGRTGDFGAFLGGYSNANDHLLQLVFIPEDATQARLSFWRGFVGGDAGDAFFLRILDADDNLLTTLGTLDHTASDGYWHAMDYDLSAYIGQQLKIDFYFVNNSTGAAFYLDDVQLNYGDEVNPAVADRNVSNVLQEGEATFEIVFDEEMNTAVSPVVIFNATQALRLSQDAAPYTLTAKTGAGYTNGYLDSNPTRWFGVYNFTGSVPQGEYQLSVSHAQDIAQNVMFPNENVATFIFDVDAPQIDNTSPQNNATNVPANADLLIIFNESMNSSTFVFTISPNPGGNVVSWSGEDSVVTIAHNDFTPGQTYTVSVSQVEDLVGHPLAGAPYQWTFTAAAPDLISPEMSGRWPAPNATNVDINTAVVISFSEAINSATFAYAMAPDPGGWQVNWSNDNSVVTLTHAEFLPGIPYQVTIATAEDLAGNDLIAVPIMWSFTTGYKVYLPMIIK